MPKLLVTSSQLLQERWRSPLIGKEILIGSVLAAVSSLAFKLIHAYTWPRVPGASLNLAPVGFLAGGQQSFYAIL